jgi:hypothetical protein
MKITANLFLAAAFLCVTACSDNGKKTDEDTATAADISSGSVPVLPNTPAPASDQAQPAAPAASASAATALNPPHGEPGHNCAIAVGAPLNSASIGPQQNQNVRLPAVIPAQSSGPVAPGMNPPHGQPGHDCSVAVGAPLKK